MRPLGAGTGRDDTGGPGGCGRGFGALGLGRVDGLAQVGGTASRRVAEKAGPTVEGVLHERIVHRRGRADAWIGGLLPGDLGG